MHSVFLIGFMASGKSTVGREVAVAMGMPFVDLDEEIEMLVGRPIPEIFAVDGEASFRAIENDVLSKVIGGLGGQAKVVATGGGSPMADGNLEAMRDAGMVVALEASLETLAERGQGSDRPLLASGVDDTRALFEARSARYRQAHACLDVESASPRQLAAQVASLASLADGFGGLGRHSSLCPLASNPYPIVVGSGSLARVGELLARYVPGCTRIGVVTDDNVAAHYLDAVLEALAAFEVNHLAIAPGEQSKTPTMHADVAEAMVGAGLDRNSAIVALGGGVVGDLAGYVASSLFRGVPVVQVPTTLLAMTDSAIGGKTGVNLRSGKNLLGAFWQPRVVVIDPSVLATLPERELRAGIGELYKYGLLEGESLYALIDKYVADTTSNDVAMAVVARCAALKARIVARDERETTGERALLNLGHTVGHAIEREAGYGTVLHGEAVALGLIAAVRVSAALGLADATLEQRLSQSLQAAGLSVDLDPWLRSEVLAHIGVDKKRTGSLIRFIAVRDVGVPEIAEITTDEITKILLRDQGL